MARIAGSDITASPSQFVARTNTFDMEDGLKAFPSIRDCIHRPNPSRDRKGAWAAVHLLHFPIRLREFRVLDRNVILGFLHLNREAAVWPRQRPAERALHPVHFAVVR